MDQFNNPLSFHGASSYKYTAWDGHFEDLGAVAVPIGGDRRNYISQPLAVSDDGTVIGGEARLDRKARDDLDSGNGHDLYDGFPDQDRRNRAQGLVSHQNQLH